MEVIGYKEIRNELTRIMNRLDELTRIRNRLDELTRIRNRLVSTSEFFRRSPDEILLKSIESGDKLTVLIELKKLVNSENLNRELKKDTLFGMWYTTTLHEAVRYGQVSIMKYLLQIGADVGKKDSDGRTALDVAVKTKSTLTSPCYFSSGDVLHNMIIIELLRQYTREKDAEILYLIRKGCFNELKKLVNSENVNRELKKYTLFGMQCTTTALHEAVRYGQFSIVKYLLKVGADVDKKDSKGRTVLDVAVEEEPTRTPWSILREDYCSSAVTRAEVLHKRIIELLLQYTRKKDAKILYLIRKGCFYEDFITWNQAKTNCHSHATMAKRFGHVSFNWMRLYNSKHHSKIKPKDRWKGSKQMFDTEVDEDVLLKKCWFPFGLHSLVVGPGGGDFPLDCGDSLLEVPEGAFEKEVVIRYGIALYGPWELPEGYTPCSVTVYLNLQGHHPNKELTLHLSNWYGGKERDGVRFVRAPHILKEGESKYQFTLLEEGDFSDVRRGKLKIGQPLCLYAVALRDLDKKERFQVNAVQRVIGKAECRPELRILFSVQSYNWIEILKELYNYDWELRSQWTNFQFGENDVRIVGVPDCSWINGKTGIEKEDFVFRGKTSEELKVAVERYHYPPYIQCFVHCECPRTQKISFYLKGTDRRSDPVFHYFCNIEKANEEDIQSPVEETHR